jgi:DNA-binding NarL/FixJ family response regulator
VLGRELHHRRHVGRRRRRRGDLESGGGLGGRAHEILEAGRLGLTNPEIAEALVLSHYKVQDQIKSLFEKTGVSSR